MMVLKYDNRDGVISYIMKMVDVATKLNELESPMDSLYFPCLSRS